MSNAIGSTSFIPVSNPASATGTPAPEQGAQAETRELVKNYVAVQNEQEQLQKLDGDLQRAITRLTNLLNVPRELRDEAWAKKVSDIGQQMSPADFATAMSEAERRSRG